MIEVLEFIFRDSWTFLGVLVLVSAIRGTSIINFSFKKKESAR